ASRASAIRASLRTTLIEHAHELGQNPIAILFRVQIPGCEFRVQRLQMNPSVRPFAILAALLFAVVALDGVAIILAERLDQHQLPLPCAHHPATKDAQAGVGNQWLHRTALNTRDEHLRCESHAGWRFFPPFLGDGLVFKEWSGSYGQ